jgi:hypothetical protein
MNQNSPVPKSEDCISPEMVVVYRDKTPTQRLQIAFGMWRSARKLIVAAVRNQHPDFTEDQVQREVARRMSNGTT